MKNETEMDMDECFRCARARYLSEINEEGDIEDQCVGDSGNDVTRSMWERWAQEQGKRWGGGMSAGEAEGEGRGEARIPFWYREYAPRLWTGVGM